MTNDEIRAACALRAMSGMAMSEELRATFNTFVGHFERLHGPLHPPPEARGKHSGRILAERALTPATAKTA